jgi:arginyl-tRNA synthetase
MMDIHNANDLTVTQITHDEIILGDWNNRKKLPCVQRFRKGSIYVREDLAYIRTRIPYHNNDKLWRYLGKQEDYYIWGWKYINDLWWTEPVQFEKPLENMVVFRQNAKGYQVVRK